MGTFVVEDVIRFIFYGVFLVVVLEEMGWGLRVEFERVSSLISGFRGGIGW